MTSRIPTSATSAVETCPCGCCGRARDHDDRGWGPWPCPACGNDSDRDVGRPCSDCEGDSNA